MITTPNMSLIRWDQNSDPYSHQQLSANFNTIDLHDHSEGKGVPIRTESIENLAVTEIKLADGAVTTEKLADGAVTEDKLDAQYVHPLGEVMQWWRPSTQVAIPSGWVIAMGQTLLAAEHGFGGGSITLPDLRNKFILGADVAGTGVSTTTPPAIGASGGGHTANLVHSHTVNAHSHTVNLHTHAVEPHSHRVEDHTHGMMHTHHFPFPIVHDLLTHRLLAIWPGSDLLERNMFDGNDGNTTLVESLLAGHIDGFRPEYRIADIGPVDTLSWSLDDPPGAHLVNKYFTEVSEPRVFDHPNDFNRETGARAPMTDVQVPDTSPVSPGTSSSSPATNNALATQDLRPAHVGLLTLMKVKHHG